MTSVVLKNAVDTYVSEKYPSANYVNSSVLWLDNTTAQRKRIYLYFSLPFPRGVTVLSAKLRLRQGATNAIAGSVTNTVQRISGWWASAKTTWNVVPAVSGSTVGVTKSSPPGATIWEFDVTSIMQTVSDGAIWYGFRVITNSTDPTLYNSCQSSILDWRPELEIEWSDVPEAPTQLYPNDGHIVASTRPVLRFNFTDLSGDTTMESAQVQVHTTSDFTSPAFDSGEIITDVPQVDLSTTAFTALTSGQTRYWRVRVKDGAGLWSDWSDPESFTYQGQGTLTLNNPAASPNNYVEEATPPISWTFTGQTQKAYQILVWRDSTNLGEVPWSSGKITGTATSYTLPAGVLKSSAFTAKIEVRVWDTLLRESIPGAPAYASVTREFTLNWSGTVSVVSALTATASPTGYPWGVISWTRGTTPDLWNIYRDGELIDVLLGVEPFVSGTSYQYVDHSPQPRRDNIYTVVPVVNGKGSSSNPTATLNLRARSIFLSDKEGNYPIYLWSVNKDSLEIGENATVFEPIGDSPPVVIFGSSNQGLRGEISGTLSGELLGITAQQAKERYKQLVRLQGQLLWLTIVDETIEVFIINRGIIPRSTTNEVLYDVTFEFYQTDAS